MPKTKDLALMTGLDKVYGCGALNWDIFFEVPSLDALKNIPSVNFEAKPGGEVAVSREEFLEILSHLEKQGKRVFSCGGGSAANTIFALSHLGFKTGFIGVCGDDEFGKLVLEELSQAKVDLSLVERHGETSLALIVLDAVRDRFIIVSPGSAEALFQEGSFLERAKERLLKERTLLHLSSLASLEGQDFQKRLLSELSPKEKLDHFVSFDPGQVYAQKGRNFLLDFLPYVDIFFATEGELFEAGLKANEVLNHSVLVLFLKRGKRGAKALTKDFEYSQDVIPQEKVVDNTGAGDYFNSGVLAGLMLGKTIDKALYLGALLASLSLSDYGRRGILFINGQSLLKCE
jgi:sugar/nucleoside kinase (ribokinase family)